MSEYTETILNSNCDRFWYVRVGEDINNHVIAFTNTYEDAEHIVNALLRSKYRAVIEEYSRSDVTVIIEKKGRGV